MKNPRLIPVAVVALLVAGLGGYGCGLALDKFAYWGGVSLWGLGWLAGFVVNGMRVDGSRIAGWMLVVALVTAFMIAETCWIHWNTIQGEESWLTALTWLPTFIQENPISSFTGALFTFFGATSAYRQVAIRYVKVPVERERSA